MPPALKFTPPRMMVEPETDKLPMLPLPVLAITAPGWPPMSLGKVQPAGTSM